ncbi:hypothetical protein C8F01DRAFT_1125747 [Mycena amicta]|nr:hypothetical protein C8F01DRAFT_1125747 [Mycena amicta]
MALPTNGRVIIETTVGEIDIELWSKVCKSPRRLQHWRRREFLAGYYDNVIFSSVLVQTGDKTGTGGGGEDL